MQKHKYNIFPEMNQEDYERLKSDLSINGFDITQPIYIYENAVLDGWNRLRACKELGISPVKETFTGSAIDAIEFVMRTNKRRNLTSSQWAIIADEAEELIKAIRQEIEKERRRKISESRSGGHETRQLIGESKEEEDRTDIRIAKLFNTNKTYVSDAKKLRKENPELAEKVKAGEINLTKVKKEEKKKKFEQKKKEFETEIKPININQVIIHGDSVKILPTLKANSYDLLLTDPPYGMDFKSGWSDKEKIANDKLHDTIELFESVLSEAVPLLKQDAHFYIFGNIDYLPSIKPIIEKYLTLKNIIIWDRNIIGMGDLKTYGRSYDVIYFGYNKKWKDLNGTRDRDVFRFNRIDPIKNIHPTEKPLEILEYIIKKSTNENDLVLDPFAGGGSTLLACKNTNRKATGIEIENEYFDLIKERI